MSLANSAGVDRLDDARLVARCCAAIDSPTAQREADDAFAELVRRYRDKVFRLAVSILGQEFAPEAEDVAQDVMLRVHHSMKQFRGDAQFGSWIYRITFNHALNVKDRVRFRAPHVSEVVLDTHPSNESGPHDQLQAARQKQAVQECLRELPEVYQSALRLHYWLGAGISEIAAMLDVPENTVKSYLYRARKLLHAQLTQRGFNER